VARRTSQGDWQRYAAPTAFLAVATIAIVLVASALHGSPSPSAPTLARPPATTTTAAPASSTARTTTAAVSRRYYTVVAGDTFGVIASKSGTSVATLEQLNPGVSSTSLHVGQKLRVA
jgi:LysM repeat protein